MSEADIIRTTIYLPRTLHALVKKKGINLSKEVRRYLEHILTEGDEMDVKTLDRKIMEQRKNLEILEASRQRILEKEKEKQLKEKEKKEKEEKIVKYFNNLFQQNPWELEHTLKSTEAIRYIHNEFGVNISSDEILKMQREVISGKDIKAVVLPYFDKNKSKEENLK